MKGQRTVDLYVTVIGASHRWAGGRVSRCGCYVAGPCLIRYDQPPI